MSFRWCEDMNIPFTYEILRSFAKGIVQLKNPDAEAKLCQGWCKSFKKRHNFSTRKARYVERARTVAGATSDMIIEYFKLLEETYKRLNLSDKPNHVWNLDEKGWSKQQALQQPVFVSKGKPQVKNKKTYVLFPGAQWCVISSN